MQKKIFFRSQFGKMASTSYSAVEVIDLLDTEATQDQCPSFYNFVTNTS